jgi:hypothetical protein
MALEGAKNDGVLWREGLEELACADRFARARAADYGGKPGWVTMVAGGAADQGLVKALAGDDSKARDQFAAGRGGPPAQADCVVTQGSAQVDAYVGWAEAPTAMKSRKDQDPELRQLCSPYANIGKTPGLRARLFYGPRDQVVSSERVVAIVQVLKAAGYDASLTEPAEGDCGYL